MVLVGDNLQLCYYFSKYDSSALFWVNEKIPSSYHLVGLMAVSQDWKSIQLQLSLFVPPLWPTFTKDRSQFSILPFQAKTLWIYYWILDSWVLQLMSMLCQICTIYMNWSTLLFGNYIWNHFKLVRAYIVNLCNGRKSFYCQYLYRPACNVCYYYRELSTTMQFRSSLTSASWVNELKVVNIVHQVMLVSRIDNFRLYFGCPSMKWCHWLTDLLPMITKIICWFLFHIDGLHSSFKRSPHGSSSRGMY